MEVSMKEGRDMELEWLHIQLLINKIQNRLRKMDHEVVVKNEHSIYDYYI